MQGREKPYRHENLYSAGLESLFQKHYYILSCYMSADIKL